MSIQPSTHDEILATWLEEQGDLEMVLFKHKLTPAQLRDFVADPIVIATMDAHESLLARRRRILASMHQQNAAEMLSKSMFESSSLIECRRAATSLARLTRDMTRPTRDLAPRKETTAQAVAPHSPLPLPVASNGERCPKGGEGSSMDAQITTHAPPPTREPGRVAPPSPPAAPITARDGRTPNEPLRKPHQPTTASLPTTQNLTPPPLPSHLSPPPVTPRRKPASFSAPTAVPAPPTLVSATHGSG